MYVGEEGLQNEDATAETHYWTIKVSNHVTSQLKSIQSPSASCGAREFNHDAVVLGIRSSRMCAAAVVDSSLRLCNVFAKHLQCSRNRTVASIL